MKAMAIKLVTAVQSRQRLDDEGAVSAEYGVLLAGVVAVVAIAAAASTWIRNETVCPSTVLAYLSVDDASPDSSTCSTTGNSRQGTLTVTARDASPLSFPGLLGRSSAAIQASTTVRTGSPGSLLNVWLIALCDKHPSLLAWKNSGFSLTNSYIILVQSGPDSCGGNVGGNWGLLDFNGGENSTGEAIGWVQNGHDQPLNVGDSVLGAPGREVIARGLGVHRARRDRGRR